MNIPDFDHNGVLPPHLGEPTDPKQLSPYPTTSLEVCQKFCTSPDRIEILGGWLDLRGALRMLGHGIGFQWVDGSFVEEVEVMRGRPPEDIDVVSFLPPTPIGGLNDPNLLTVIADRDKTWDQFKVDHLIVRLHWPGDIVVEHTRYWCGLFSHRREDGVWKGMLKVDLNTPADDDAARRHLESLGQP